MTTACCRGLGAAVSSSYSLMGSIVGAICQQIQESVISSLQTAPTMMASSFVSEQLRIYYGFKLA